MTRIEKLFFSLFAFFICVCSVLAVIIYNDFKQTQDCFKFKRELFQSCVVQGKNAMSCASRIQGVCEWHAKN